MIVYYYIGRPANHIQRRDAERLGDILDDTTFVPIGNHEYCLAVDRHQCPDRSRIFDRRTYEPEVDTAGELRSDRRLIHICDVRRGPYDSARPYGSNCDLQTFGTSVAHTGYTGGFHPIAGCRGWVVAA